MKPYFFLVLFILVFGCKKTDKSIDKVAKTSSAPEIVVAIPNGIETPKGMVWIPGGSFLQGAVAEDALAMQHEKPSHKVTVTGFFMDKTEVTNEQFSKFVEETGYITVAERAVDWNLIKKQLPAGTPKPADSLLQPGSLTFLQTKTPVKNLQDFSQWWRWTVGANWRHPKGPNSTLQGLENHPVVHMAYEDAVAYCKWAKRRLPTEAEWEYAAKGGTTSEVYYWGNSTEDLSTKANTWTGLFPATNDLEDRFLRTAPIASYPENNYNLYDMAGNVWEWTSDWYNINYYKELASSTSATYNPKGAEAAYNPNNPYEQERVIKGGSFLCSASYCASYRISSRMATGLESSAEHIGFRTVVDVSLLEKNLN